MGRVIAGAAMVVLAGTLAYGQAGGQTGGEGGIRVGGQATPPLAGPSAGDAIAKPTLVERAYDGTLKRLELPPAEAAVALLELDDAARVRVEALIAERAAAVDEVVIGNIELLVSVKGAGESGDRVRAIGLLRKLDEAFGGIEPVRKFEERLGGAMGLVQRQEFMALLDEYRDAVAEDRRRALEREGAARRELRPRALRLRAAPRRLRRPRASPPGPGASWPSWRWSRRGPRPFASTRSACPPTWCSTRCTSSSKVATTSRARTSWTRTRRSPSSPSRSAST